MFEKIVSVTQRVAPKSSEKALDTVKHVIPEADGSVQDIIANAMTCAARGDSPVVMYKGMDAETAKILRGALGGRVRGDGVSVNICSMLSEVGDDWTAADMFKARLSSCFIGLYNAAYRGESESYDERTGHSLPCAGLEYIS